MRRAPFFVIIILLLVCCLGIELIICPRQAFAGAAPARNEPSGIVAMSSHGIDELREGCTMLSLDVVELSGADTELPSGNAIVAFEPALEDLEGLQLKVGYVDEKSIRILTDLHSIYTSPIKVNGNDLCLLLVGGGTLLLVDQDIYDRINAGPRTPEARRISGVVTEFGNSLSALAICGLISVKDPETAYLGANAVAYSGIACLTLKAAFGRARPWTGEGQYAFSGPTISDDYNSMPSGHSATAFALATVLARQYPEYKRLFYACASLIALSRVYTHAHWPSDVFVGAALGVWSANQVMGSSRILEVRW